MISGGFALYAAVRIVTPDLMMRSYDHTKYQSNDQYWAVMDRTSRANDREMTRLPEAELTEERQNQYAIALAEERRDGAQQLLRSLSFFVTGGLVLFFHWQLVRRLRAESSRS
jgi:hypothetical protein